MSIPFSFRPTPSPTRNNDWLPPLSAPSLSLRTLDRTAQIGQSTFNDLQISRPLQPRIFSPYEFESITANEPSLDDPIEDDFAGFCNDPATIALLRQFDDVIGSKFSPYDNRPTYSASEKFFSQSMKQLQITHRIDGLSIHTLEDQTKGTTQALGAYNARAYQFLNVSYQSEVGPREALIVDLSKFNPFQAAPDPTNSMNKYLVIEMTKLMPANIPQQSTRLLNMGLERELQSRYEQNLPQALTKFSLSSIQSQADCSLTRPKSSLQFPLESGELGAPFFNVEDLFFARGLIKGCGLGLAKLARMPVQLAKQSVKSAHKVEGLLKVGKYTYSKSSASHITDIVKRGSSSGKLSRPYMKSPLIIKEIMATGKPIPDPIGIPGALRWDVPGTFRGNEGVWELVLHPEREIIYHFNFK
jgi:hypothetical protein